MRDITNQHAEPCLHLSAPTLAVSLGTREDDFALMSEALEKELDLEEDVKNAAFDVELDIDPEEDVKNAPFRNKSPSDFQFHFCHSLFGAYSYLVTCTSSQ